MSTNARTLLFVLPRYEDTEVLVVSGRDGCALPIHSRPAASNVGFEDPSPYNDWFSKRFGVPVARRYALDHEGSDQAVFVLESRATEGFEPEGTVWVRGQEVSSIPFAYEAHRTFLRAWFESPRQSATMPWAVAGGHDEALAWMDRMLEERGIARRGAPVQVKNAYVSAVFRCATSHGEVYLKTLPPLYIREAGIVARLAEWGIVELPEPLATDAARGYMLTRDMGGADLSDCPTPALLVDAVRRFAEFQVSSCGMVDVENPWPFYDARMPVLSKALQGVVDGLPALLADSPDRFTEEEVRRLRERVPYWQARCNEIQELGLPDALDHGDLRPGNIRVLEDRLIFYDWAWSAITHPFLSVVGFMHIVRAHIEDVPGGRDRLRDAYLDPWERFAPRRDLLRAFELADDLKSLYGSVLDADWLRTIWQALPSGTPHETHPDSWTLRRRQYYFAKIARRLL